MQYLGRKLSWPNWNLEMLVFAEGGKPENPEKNPRSKARTSNKINTLVAPTGIEHGPHLWEASAFTTVPSLLPTGKRYNFPAT